MQYSFSTTDANAGFTIHILPPETDVDSYINDYEGYYYTCEDPDIVWQSKSNTCDIEAGSSVLLLNDSDVSITINGWIRT